jgi:hypothetical protein
MYYIKTNDIKSAINTALSAQKHGVDIHLLTEVQKPLRSDLFASVNEIEEGKEVVAGTIFLRNPGKRLKTFKGDAVYENYGEMKKKYDSLELTDTSLLAWFDYYDSIVKNLGGYQSQFLWRVK